MSEPEQNVVPAAERPSAPRRGSTLEGRVRSLLERRGFRAVTNKVVLDHEIDVWGVDQHGRIAVAECKEYYDAGPVSLFHIRNFFGKIFDISQNYGENIYLSLFVSISGFTDPARSLCDRLKILAIDADTLEMLEKSDEEITPRHSPLEDQALLALRKQRDQLREEINRRRLISQLSQKVEEYQVTLQTRTIPSFLVPAIHSVSFWYSQKSDIPYPGLNGELQDFTVPSFPEMAHLVYRRRRFIGHRELLVPLDACHMQGGVVYVTPEALERAASPSDESRPSLQELHNTQVMTLDGSRLGTADDFRISYRDKWRIDYVKVLSHLNLRQQLRSPSFTIPADRISLREADGGWQLVAHVRLATEVAASAEY